MKYKLILSCTALFLIIAHDLISQTKMYVNYSKADCTGITKAKCLQIRFDEESNWQNFYGSIDGFNYEEGYVYEILTDKISIDNPPADGSSVKYILKEVISKNRPVVRLSIAERYTECEDVKIFKCLLVRESSETEWKPLYTEIRGFDYKEGYEFEIDAEKILISNPDEQGYVFEYMLRKVISEKPKLIISVADKKFLSEGSFKIKRMRINGELKKISDKKFNLLFNVENLTVSGNDGCNSTSGRFEINGDKIKLGPFITTRMYCNDIITDKHFYKLINETNRFKISEKGLKFYGGDKLLIELYKSN